MSDLILTHEGSLAWITIDRPRRKHSWSKSMWPEMADLLAQCSRNPEIRVALIASTGNRVFSAGADLEQFSGADGDSIRNSLEGVESVMRAIEECPTPVIAVVNGAAVGAGLEIAAACDIRIASERAWFSIPAAHLGIVITKSDIARLVRGLGGSLARDLLLTGRRLSAVEAERVGFVRSVHPSSQLGEAAVELANAISSFESSSLAAMKAHLNSIGSAPWDEESWLNSHHALLSAEAQARISAQLGGT